MTNPPPIPPIPPLDGDETDEQGVPVREVDGERQLDPDADASQVDSAEADRIAADGG